MQLFLRVAICHREPVVLERQLLPLCCGHLYLLHASESPYYCGGAPTLSDLAVAVGVCSRTFEDAQEWLANPQSQREVAAWVKRCGKLDLRKQYLAFDKYIREQSSMPERRKKVDEEGKEGCLHPWYLLVVTSLLEKVGESRAWNMPVSLALAYTSADGERNGDKSFISEKRERDVEIARQLAAQELANGTR